MMNGKYDANGSKVSDAELLASSHLTAFNNLEISKYKTQDNGANDTEYT